MPPRLQEYKETKRTQRTTEHKEEQATQNKRNNKDATADNIPQNPVHTQDTTPKVNMNSATNTNAANSSHKPAHAQAVNINMKAETNSTMGLKFLCRSGHYGNSGYIE